MTEQNADFGRVKLLAAGIAPKAAASANVPVAATLVWQGHEPGDANLSLRLQDKEGYVWSSREYARKLPDAGETVTETVGLIVPVGLPPGGYQVGVSVQTADGEPLTIAGSDAVAAVIGSLEVSPPDETRTEFELGPERLPIEYPLARRRNGAASSCWVTRAPTKMLRCWRARSWAPRSSLEARGRQHSRRRSTSACWIRRGTA